MADFIKTQNSFANGEVSPEFYSCDNINGLSCLENMDVLAGGGISRRSGLCNVAQMSGPGRLISFSVSNDEDYLIVIADYHMYIYHNDILYQDLITPWPYSALGLLQYAQRFGTMIFVHPEYQPRILCKNKNSFDLTKFVFAQNDSNLDIYIPFVRFDDSSNIKITVGTHASGNNYATFTTNSDFWTPDNVGGRLYLLERQWTITQYLSPTQVVAYVNGTYSMPSGPVSDWREAAFGNRRGWPCSITFHQDRLVFGGTRDWPGGLWMSQVGRHTNFDTGTGLDDEAIFVSLLSQQRQQICTIVSSDNLQILTNSGEWAISSKPLTPSAIDIRQHTSVGSYCARFLPPQQIEGTTVFVSGGGCDIRELSLDDLGEKYNANDLCALSKHLINSPTDLSYNAMLRRLYVVCADGHMAVLNYNRSLGISAWGRYLTDGRFISVCVCGVHTYVITKRDNGYFLERFDTDYLYDNTGFTYLCRASSLPLITSKHSAKKIRLRQVSARVINTKSITINNQDITLSDDIFDKPSGYCGDVSVNLLGTMDNVLSPLWTIETNASYSLTVLSVTVQGWYSI